MRTLNVTTFGYAENLRAKQWPEYQVGFLRHRNNNTAAEKQLEPRKHCKKHCFLIWKKWCLEKGIAKEIENFEPTQLNTLLE